MDFEVQFQSPENQTSATIKWDPHLVSARVLGTNQPPPAHASALTPSQMPRNSLINAGSPPLPSDPPAINIPVSCCYSRILNLVFFPNGGGGSFTESEFHHSHGKSASSRSQNGLLPFPIHFVKILLSFQTAIITSNWVLNYNVNFTKLLLLFISLVRFDGTVIFFDLPQTSTS